jgi:hypothetical protein
VAETTTNQNPQHAAPGKTGSVMNMSTGEKKDASGRSRGNKKVEDKNKKLVNDITAQVRAELNVDEAIRQHFGAVTAECKKVIDEGVRQVRLSQIEREAELLKTLAEAADKAGYTSLAASLRGSKPETLAEKVKAHAGKPVLRSDIYIVVGGGLILGLVYQGAMYAFRNKIAWWTPIKFKTGLAADRRTTEMGTGGRARVSIGSNSVRA